MSINGFWHCCTHDCLICMPQVLHPCLSCPACAEDDAAKLKLDLYCSSLQGAPRVADIKLSLWDLQADAWQDIPCCFARRNLRIHEMQLPGEPNTVLTITPQVWDPSVTDHLQVAAVQMSCCSFLCCILHIFRDESHTSAGVQSIHSQEAPSPSQLLKCMRQSVAAFGKLHLVGGTLQRRCTS